MNINDWHNLFIKELEPKKPMTGSEWSDAYRVIAQGTSPQPGPWRTDRTPYLKEPLDKMTDNVTEQVVLMCSSQVSKSESLINVIGYYMDQEPSPIMFMMPRIEDVESFSRERIDPNIKASKALRNKIVAPSSETKSNSRKSGDTIRMKQFPGGYLAMVGSNSPASLAGRPIRILLGDEVDRMPMAITEGSPMALAKQRTTNYFNRKIVWVSTPVCKGESNIEILFEKSIKRKYHIPCQHCGTFQEWTWDMVKFDLEGKGFYKQGSARMICKHCRLEIRDNGYPPIELVQAGEWESEYEEDDCGNRTVVNENSKSIGYHFNSLISPWVTLDSLALEYTEALRTRMGMQEFFNLKLGLPYDKQEHTIESDTVQNRRTRYENDAVPDGVLLLTAGVDVQENYIACEIVGWGEDNESWGIRYFTIPGDTNQTQVWEMLDKELSQTFQYSDGTNIGIACVCVDSGFNATKVYEFTKKRESRRFYAVKGHSNISKSFIPNLTKVGKNKTTILYVLGVGEGKGIVMSNLSIVDEGPNYCHFPSNKGFGYDTEYFKGLLSEKLVRKTTGGVEKRVWEKHYNANEPLDCRVYATAAYKILNPNMKRLSNSPRGSAYTNQTVNNNNIKRPRKTSVSIW